MTIKQIAPKRRARRPEDFTMRDKLAVLALHVPDLIIGDERNGTTNEILGLFEIDHKTPCVFGGKRDPQNGRPLRKDNGQHKAKSATEKKAAAKTKRLQRAHTDWLRRLSSPTNEITEKSKIKKRSIPSRPFQKKGVKE